MKLKFSSLITAPLAVYLVVSGNPAKAVLNYNIYEFSGNLVIETDGSLNALPSSPGTTSCGAKGAFSAFLALICTGPDASNPRYPISGPSNFSTGSGDFFPASSVSGITTVLDAPSIFSIANSYVLGTPIISSLTFNGKTLADLGLTPSSGSLGTWTLNGTTETINVRVYNPVPGPLPVLGAGAAFGFSRRLRRRVNAYRSQAQN
jgi:hypothetical protein